ncbi:hypothetical protein CHARACLAT_007813, partial [Characodon lateralis]|nr:hypothetical protein [Characodon lateralis]
NQNSGNQLNHCVFLAKKWDRDRQIGKRHRFEGDSHTDRRTLTGFHGVRLSRGRRETAFKCCTHTACAFSDHFDSDGFCKTDKEPHIMCQFFDIRPNIKDLGQFESFLGF